MTTSKGGGRERKITIVSLNPSKYSRSRSNTGGVDFTNYDSPGEENHASKNNNNNNNNVRNSASKLNEVLSNLDVNLDTTNEKDENSYLRICIKKQTKELVWLLLAFIGYILFGMFLFFYIEECSGAAKPDDASYLRDDIAVKSSYKNIEASCDELIQMFDKKLNSTISVESEHSENVTKESNISVAVEYVEILRDFKTEMVDASYPVVKKNKTRASCLITEFTLLKYAEFTVFTCLTIGYGNTTPETITGRMTMIFYALIGMPLALTMYSVAGKLVVQIITLVLQIIQKRILKSNSSDVKHLQLKILGISACLFLFIILTGSAVTCSKNMENLAFSSSFYFWFISLSTIGYGDITFKRDQHLQSPHLMMVAVMNLLFGIGILAAIIAAISLALEKRDLQMSTIIIDEEEEEEDDYDDDKTFDDDLCDDNDDDDIVFDHQDAMHKFREGQLGLQNSNYIEDEITCITDLSSAGSLNDRNGTVQNNDTKSSSCQQSNNQLSISHHEESRLSNSSSNHHHQTNNYENRDKKLPNGELNVRLGRKFTEDGLHFLKRRMDSNNKRNTTQSMDKVNNNTNTTTQPVRKVSLFTKRQNRSSSILEEM